MNGITGIIGSINDRSLLQIDTVPNAVVITGGAFSRQAYCEVLGLDALHKNYRF